MMSIGFRIFCITIAVLFFFESAFSTAFIGDTKKPELHKNSYGQLNKIEDINENEINIDFNSHGHVNWIQDQLLNETEATYDLMGRLLTVTTPLGRTYTMQYDDWGRPERLLFPQVYNEGTEQWETHDVSVEYDHGSLITLLRDELGRETSLVYDDAMRLIQATNAEEQEIFFDYYDSGTGRFLSRDPIGDGSNWYNYCKNNPAVFRDPNGLQPKDDYRVDEWTEYVMDIGEGVMASGVAVAMRNPKAGAVIAGFGAGIYLYGRINKIGYWVVEAIYSDLSTDDFSHLGPPPSKKELNEKGIFSEQLIWRIWIDRHLDQYDSPRIGSPYKFGEDPNKARWVSDQIIDW